MPVAGAGRGCMRAVLTPQPCAALFLQVAIAFKPELSWAIVDGSLQVMTPTPIGDRLETFRLDEATTDVDPDGNTFVKRSAWRSGGSSRQPPARRATSRRL